MWRMLTGRLATLALVLLFGACGAPASPSPSQSPTATAEPGQAILDAFLGLTHAPDRSMHVEYTLYPEPSGTAQLQPQVAAAYDIDGREFSGSISVGRSSLVQLYRCVEGMAYLGQVDRDGVRTFFSGTPGCEMPYGAPDPFIGLSRDDAAYLGPESADGTLLHRVRLADPLAAARNLVGEYAGRVLVNPYGGISDAGSTFDVFLDDDGHPVTATLLIRAASSRGPLPYQRYEFTFSRWGEHFAIAVPEVWSGEGVSGAERLFVDNEITEAITVRDAKGHSVTIPACQGATIREGDLDLDVDHLEILAVDGSVIAIRSADPTDPGYRRIGIVQVFTDGANFLEPDFVTPIGICLDRPRSTPSP